MSASAATCRTGCRAPSGLLMAQPLGQQGPAQGPGKPHRGDRRWVQAWSPEQITNRLKVDFPHDETMRISHEAIYQAFYVQGRGALKRELVACLRTGRALRVPRLARTTSSVGARDPRGADQRTPAEADDRAVPGHWEGDLLIGLERSAIGTLVERSTRFTMRSTCLEKMVTGSSPGPRTARLSLATVQSR